MSESVILVVVAIATAVVVSALLVAVAVLLGLRSLQGKEWSADQWIQKLGLAEVLDRELMKSPSLQRALEVNEEATVLLRRVVELQQESVQLLRGGLPVVGQEPAP